MNQANHTYDLTKASEVFANSARNSIFAPSPSPAHAEEWTTGRHGCFLRPSLYFSENGSKISRISALYR